MVTRVNKCRICRNPNLVPVLDLGVQTLTGVFPRSKATAITRGPLELVLCSGKDGCGLTQLAHSFDAHEMYGENYGYRSGLNPSMVAHLGRNVQRILNLDVVKSGDVIVDIGSNDGTTLRQYGRPDCTLVGIDPTATKFGDYYDPAARVVADFFSKAAYERVMGRRKAKVATTFAMFYDLDDPTRFMAEVHSILADDGVWVLEQSYMPLMLETNSYDTVCHEHLEYYTLAQIEWMAEKVGFEVVDVELNDVNGGSFLVTVQKTGGPLRPSQSVNELRYREAGCRLTDLATYARFRSSVQASRETLLNFLRSAKADGKRVVGLGASTKGNVILQYCGIMGELIDCIAEVNPEKFGRFTPGTLIPIRDEREVLEEKPDYLLVLPWHFRAFFETEPRYKSHTLVFPLPELSITAR